jgi:hypothetical protein
MQIKTLRTIGPFLARRNPSIGVRRQRSPAAVDCRGNGNDACPRRSSAKEFAYRNGEAAVKAFLAACLVAVLLALAGWLVLNDAQEPVDRAFATPPYTRVGD